MLRFELYAPSVASPQALWAIVGDLRRLPEWTDATAVEQLTDLPLEVGAQFVTVRADERLSWTLVTVEPRLLEARTQTPRWRLSVGVRVAADPAGARLILAGLLDPSTGRLRARIVAVPRLRRRFEVWSQRAVELANRGAAAGPE